MSLGQRAASYRLSIFENDPTPGKLESWPNTIAHNSAEMAAAANFFLRLPTLTAGNFEAILSTGPKSLASKDLNLLNKAKSL